MPTGRTSCPDSRRQLTTSYSVRYSAAACSPTPSSDSGGTSVSWTRTSMRSRRIGAQPGRARGAASSSRSASASISAARASPSRISGRQRRRAVMRARELAGDRGRDPGVAGPRGGGGEALREVGSCLRMPRAPTRARRRPRACRAAAGAARGRARRRPRVSRTGERSESGRQGFGLRAEVRPRAASPCRGPRARRRAAQREVAPHRASAAPGA